MRSKSAVATRRVHLSCAFPANMRQKLFEYLRLFFSLLPRLYNLHISTIHQLLHDSHNLPFFSRFFNRIQNKSSLDFIKKSNTVVPITSQSSHPSHKFITLECFIADFLSTFSTHSRSMYLLQKRNH